MKNIPPVSNTFRQAQGQSESQPEARPKDLNDIYVAIALKKLGKSLILPVHTHLLSEELHWQPFRQFQQAKRINPSKDPADADWRFDADGINEFDNGITKIAGLLEKHNPDKSARKIRALCNHAVKSALVESIAPEMRSFQAAMSAKGMKDYARPKFEWAGLIFHNASILENSPQVHIETILPSMLHNMDFYMCYCLMRNKLIPDDLHHEKIVAMRDAVLESLHIDQRQQAMIQHAPYRSLVFGAITPPVFV